MGNTSTQVKQQWNSSHYTQVKISVDPATASAFKSACTASDVSMTSVLSKFMNQYSQTVIEKKGYSLDLSTRRQRRAAIRSLIYQLLRVRDGEEHYRDNIPENLQGSEVFERADQCACLLNEAIELLESAY